MTRIKRALCGFGSYWNACELTTIFSECILYEPCIRVLVARGYVVTCEYPCDEISSDGDGDKKRIDFVAVRNANEIAIEVKWTDEKSFNVARDIAKLVWFKGRNGTNRSFLCVFGVKSDIEALALKGIDSATLQERDEMKCADMGRATFSCRLFEVFPK